jgi:hypothetical protein
VGLRGVGMWMTVLLKEVGSLLEKDDMWVGMVRRVMMCRYECFEEIDNSRVA